MRTSLIMSAAMIFAVMLARSVWAEDWPTYMHDPARSGVSSETLALPLAELWAYVPPAESRLSERSGHAWPDPQAGESYKFHFDEATHVALAGDTVFFGSSVDNGIHALDAATGARRWTVFTEGPVRLAPTFADGRVYAGSDDGAVYCVAAGDGRLVWKVQPLPGATRIIGAGRLMSLWPIRTGVLVDGGVAYCGAGIFAAQGKGIFALDAGSGTQIWKSAHIHNKTHDSPQGYLVASAEHLYVFRGRVDPQVYARSDGAWRATLSRRMPGKGLYGGGGYGALIDDLLYFGTQNLLFGYKPDGQSAGIVKSTHKLVATSKRYYRLTGRYRTPSHYDSGERAGQVIAINRPAYDTDGRKDPIPKDMLLWRYQGSNLQSLIVAGPHVVVGGLNEVIALDAATGKAVWNGKVDGLAKGLAVANGRLVVSTDKGRLHCFGKGLPARAVAKPVTDPFPRDADTARITALADAIAKDAKLDRGYALVIPASGRGLAEGGGGGGARLAYELAKRTGLLIHVAEPDTTTAAKARAALSAAGAYGTSAPGRDLAKGGKVVVDVMPSDGTNGLPYPPYFANLVVVAGLPQAGAQGGPGAPRTAFEPRLTAKEIMRTLKPSGGVLYAAAAARRAAWTNAGAVTQVKLAGAGAWTKLVRGRLPGARDWTHHLADAGNTGSSDDERVRGRPEVLWYGEPGPKQMHDRASGSEAPLSFYGRMFVQGMREQTKTPLLLCFDAYNGVPYWERELPPGAERFGVGGDCGNLACSTQGLFLAVSNQCLRLDLLTGETRATYAVPAQTSGATGRWAYVAVEGDTLVGSAYASNRFSNVVFAYDLRTGRLKWRYTLARNAARSVSHSTAGGGAVIRNSTLALQGGKVFFAEHRGQASALSRSASGGKVPDPLAQARDEQARRRGAAGAATNEPASGPEPCMRTVVALDLATGKQAWARDVDLAGCGTWAGNLCLSAKHEVLLLSGLYSNYGRPKGDEDQRRALALSAQDGATLWNRAIANRKRPVLVGDQVIGMPGAFDLRTGEPVLLSNGRPWGSLAGACGQISASAGILFQRAGAVDMVDVETGRRLLNFSGMRPSCLISIIPAGGVIVQVEGSSGCACDFAMQATVAFVPPRTE